MATPDWLSTLIGLGAVRFYDPFPDNHGFPMCAMRAQFGEWDAGYVEDRWAAVMFGSGPGKQRGWETLTPDQRGDFVRFVVEVGLEEQQSKVLEQASDEIHAQVTDLTARHDLLKGRLRELRLGTVLGNIASRLKQIRWVYEGGGLTPQVADEWVEAFTADIGLAPHSRTVIDEGVTARLMFDKVGRSTLVLTFAGTETLRRFCAKHDLWGRVEWDRLAVEAREAVGKREEAAEKVAGLRELRHAVQKEVGDV